MSLRVWLPLDGDLRNQGASGASVTNTSATINTTGKIGSCYQFGTGKSYLKFNDMDFIHDFTECSITLWIKILSWNTSYATYFQLGLGSTPWAHYIFGLLRNNAASTLCFTISNGSSATNANCLTPALDLNTWYHLTFTYADGHCKIYVNGAETKDYNTTIVPNFSRITTGTIGVANNLTSYQTNCLINDFRIYDHCLSAAEVHEIAQGLVLHYKLDGGILGNPNLLLNTHFDNRYSQTTGWDTTKNGTLLANNWGGYNSGVANASTSYHAHLKQLNNEYVYEYIKESETWLGISQGGLQSKLTAGKTYTFSCEQYSVTNTNYMTGGLYYFKTGATSAGFHLGQMACNSNRIQGTWQKFIYTFIAPSDGDYSKNMSWYCYGQSGGSGTFYLRHLKLEEGSVATPWAPTAAEANYDRSIIEDSSGYNHNAVLAGAATIVSDTPRYNVSTHFSANSQYIGVTGLTTSGFGSTYSFSWWEKRASYSGTMAWGFQNGIRLNGLYNGNLWNTGDSSNNPLYTPGTTTQVLAPTANVWHHFVMTGDGTTCKVYQDGVFWAQAKTFKQISGTNLYINGWDTGTSYKSTNMSVSDFRLYATALTADDALTLYHTGAKIDNKQNLHTFELNEINSNIFAGKIWSNSYSSHTPLTSPFINYNLNGEPQFTTNGTSAGSEYIKITPGTYEYDYTISVNTGNQFYIGIERYDANKTSRSNAACVYTTAIKPTTDIVKQRYKGTVNLTTDGTNTIDTITLRILNGWSGTTSGVTGLATIHSFSLKLQSSGIDPSLKRTGQFIAGEFKEETNTKFYKDHIVEANEFIEL